MRNITADTAFNVHVTDFLPSSLNFLNSLPTPASQVDNQVMWTFPTIAAGESKLVLLRGALDPTTDPGTVLENLVNVSDDAENLSSVSFVGRVRGVRTNLPPLSLVLSTVTRTFPGSQLRLTYKVKNTGLAVANSVVLTVTPPEQSTFVLSTPPPTSTANGQFVWQLGTMVKSAQSTIRLTMLVNNDVAPGTVLTASG